MAGRKAGGGQESQGVEVALAPEELELDPMAMTQKYEEHVREQQAQVEKEDFSDMVAEHAAKQKVHRPTVCFNSSSLHLLMELIHALQIFVKNTICNLFLVSCIIINPQTHSVTAAHDLFRNKGKVCIWWFNDFNFLLR